MKKSSNEFKVGIFFIICMLGLMVITLKTNKVKFKKGGYNIYVVFKDIAGLEKESPVLLNGLEVGKVDDIEVVYAPEATEIKLKVWLKEGVEIRESPTVSIKALGLMGDKSLQITSLEGTRFIKPDVTLEGEPYVDMDALMDNVNQLTNEVKVLTTNLNATVGANQNEISAMVKNLESASKNLDEFSADIKSHPWKLLFKPKEKKAKPKKKN